NVTLTPIQLSILSLHDALPICETVMTIVPVSGYLLSQFGTTLPVPAATPPRWGVRPSEDKAVRPHILGGFAHVCARPPVRAVNRDRKSTRLNSSHRTISYAVFC